MLENKLAEAKRRSEMMTEPLAATGMALVIIGLFLAAASHAAPVESRESTPPPGDKPVRAGTNNLARTREAIKNWKPDYDVRHDQYGIAVDGAQIQERLQTPFRRPD